MERTPNKGKGLLDEPTEVARIGDETTGLRPGDFDLAPGTHLGEFVIERPLGHGGMGDVFAAIHPTIGKRAAVKVIKKELSNEFAVQRFQDEAKVVNAIGHPNIVDIFAFGEMPDGRCYYIMELLLGQSLRERIARGPIDAEETCAILKPLCRALDAAHAKGVIHRDLKPDNIFLVDVPGEPPIIKLLDFGIAKLAKTDHRIEQTKSGVMVGTPQYVAPEQAKGHAVDARADIYALGGIAFEMLTGRPPFEADNAMEMVAKHLMEKPVKPSTVIADVPPELDTLVLAMLAKQPGQRPPLSDVALVIDRMKVSISVDDVSTFRRGETNKKLPARPAPTPSTAPTTIAPAPAFAAETLAPVLAPVPAVVHTTERDVTIPASRGKYIALSIILLGAATLISFLVISALKSKSSTPAADAAEVIAEADATAIAIDAALPAVDAAPAISIDAAVVIVDAAPVIADAAVAPIDARVQTPPLPKKGRLVITLPDNPKNAVVKLNGAVIGRGITRIEVPVTLGDVYRIEVTAEARKTAVVTVTPRTALTTKAVPTPLDLMDPGGK